MIRLFIINKCTCRPVNITPYSVFALKSPTRSGEDPDYKYTKNNIKIMTEQSKLSLVECKRYGIIPRLMFRRLQPPIFLVRVFNLTDNILSFVLSIFCQNYYFVAKKRWWILCKIALSQWNKWNALFFIKKAAPSLKLLCYLSHRSNIISIFPWQAAKRASRNIPHTFEAQTDAEWGRAHKPMWKKYRLNSLVISIKPLRAVAFPTAYAMRNQRTFDQIAIEKSNWNLIDECHSEI
jgi:hypothetical protein